METTINLDQVRPERVSGYPTNYVGVGWVERANGTLLHQRNLRATIVLNDDDARKAVAFALEHPGYVYPLSFTDDRIIGFEVIETELSSVR